MPKGSAQEGYTRTDNDTALSLSYYPLEVKPSALTHFLILHRAGRRNLNLVVLPTALKAPNFRIFNDDITLAGYTALQEVPDAPFLGSEHSAPLTHQGEYP